MALDDGQLWTNIAIALTAIGAAIAILAGLMVWLIPIAALFIPAIAAAAFLGSNFNRQGGYAPGWFTKADLESWAKSNIGAVLVALAAVGTIIGSVLALTGAGVLLGAGAKIFAVIETGAFAALAYAMLRREESVLNSGDLISAY